MLNRRLSRSLVLQILFYLDFNNFFSHNSKTEKNNFNEIYNYFLEDLLNYLNTKTQEKNNNTSKEYKINKKEKDFYSYFIIENILKNKEKIDQIIQILAPEWPLNKISIINRNILRVGIFELILVTEIPEIIAISEANKLSDKFNIKKTDTKFITGVLSNLYKTAEKLKLKKNPKETSKENEIKTQNLDLILKELKK